MNPQNNYGWICPKCGCPNAPANKSCVSCHTPETTNEHNKSKDDTKIPLYEGK